MKKKLILFPQTGRYSQCKRYAVDWNSIGNETEDMQPNASWPIEQCRQGWEYNKTEVSSSIVIDVYIDIFPRVFALQFYKNPFSV